MSFIIKYWFIEELIFFFKCECFKLCFLKLLILYVLYKSIILNQIILLYKFFLSFIVKNIFVIIDWLGFLYFVCCEFSFDLIGRNFQKVRLRIQGFDDVTVGIDRVRFLKGVNDQEYFEVY